VPRQDPPSKGRASPKEGNNSETRSNPAKIVASPGDETKDLSAVMHVQNDRTRRLTVVSRASGMIVAEHRAKPVASIKRIGKKVVFAKRVGCILPQFSSTLLEVTVRHKCNSVQHRTGGGGHQ